MSRYIIALLAFGSVALLITVLSLILGIGFIRLGCNSDAPGGCPAYEQVNVSVSYTRVVPTNKYCPTDQCYEVHVYFNSDEDCTTRWQFDNIHKVNETLKVYVVGSYKMMLRTKGGFCEELNENKWNLWFAGVVLLSISGGCVPLLCCVWFAIGCIEMHNNHMVDNPEDNPLDGPLDGPLDRPLDDPLDDLSS